MKLVVTGQTFDGTAVFVQDGKVEPVVVAGFEALQNWPLWGGDAVPSLPSSGSRPAYKDFFPPVGGFRFFVFGLEPESPDAQAMAPTEDQVVGFDALFPGLLSTWEPDAPGMHTTDTVDLGVVLHGTMVLELDDGAERTLTAGDAFVQNGTRHRWRNPGPGPTALAVAMLGTGRQP